MSQLDSDLTAESMAQLSFSFEPRDYLEMASGRPISAVSGLPACAPNAGVILSFPAGRRSACEHTQQAELLRKILHRSRFF